MRNLRSHEIWIKAMLNSSGKYNQTQIEILSNFWTKFYNYINPIDNKRSSEEESLKSHSENQERKKNKVPGMRYKEYVFDLIDKMKEKNMTNEDLYDLQSKIESETVVFDEESVHKTYPSIMNILIGEGKNNARDYLLNLKRLSKEDIQIISMLGVYTIEAVMVYVLGGLFNNPSKEELRIDCHKLVEHLDRVVRTQAFILYKRKYDHKNEISINMDKFSLDQLKKNKFSIGKALVQLLIDKNIIELYDSINNKIKKKNIYVNNIKYFVHCHIDLSILTVQLSLPMIYPPLKWECISNQNRNSPMTINDLKGGYLCMGSHEMYHRYSLLTSKNADHFYIELDPNKYESLCEVMNALQNQPFEINSSFLNFINENEEELVANGLLLPKFLSEMNILKVENALRHIHSKDKIIGGLFSFPHIQNVLSKDIQRSQFEQFILKVARVYSGLKIYFPVFLDFRGRIYRSGIIHFHERDLAKSLITFSDSDAYKKIENRKELREVLLLAAAFNYKSYTSNEEAYNHFVLAIKDKKIKDIINMSQKAKNPFQFLNIMFSYSQKDINLMNRLPITQDASASAYQIMSYFLLDECLAKRTNVFPSLNGNINDVYKYILHEVVDYINNLKYLDSSKKKVFIEHLSRKLVKSIFMPIIYGKTQFSAVDDIMELLSHFIVKKDCTHLAKIFYAFFKETYSEMDSLIHIISQIGWLVASAGGEVRYAMPFLCTVQDYLQLDTINVTLYNLKRKRIRMNFKTPGTKKNTIKTKTATFVNLIHQRDAYIAMSVIQRMIELSAPIYTVHDNFISTPYYSRKMALTYSEVFTSMYPPLQIINEFIIRNLLPDSDYINIGNYPYKYDNVKGRIPLDILEKMLISLIPADVKSSKLASYHVKIKSIIVRYDEYTTLLCGTSWRMYNSVIAAQYSESEKSHINKWNSFRDKILPKGKDVRIQSLHY